ncbi:RAD52 homolog (S. cerevisiae), isoform CRA_c [Mus musculus]|nr:RAD52 homolog (S. cerevisiae), isoform CRA_c [Mus musculus]
MAGPEEAVHRGCDNHPPFVGGKSVLLFGQEFWECTWKLYSGQRLSEVTK